MMYFFSSCLGSSWPMNNIQLAPDFQNGENYRLLAVEPQWLKNLNGSVIVPTSGGDGRKRPREESDDYSVVMVMKGADHLLSHDSVGMHHVRRVEYSNSLLVAARRWTDDSVRIPSPSVESLRTEAVSVVIATLSRLFETQVTRPLENVVQLLGRRPLSLEELEADAAWDGPQASPGTSDDLLTFREMALRCSCSPAQVAAALLATGAVLHHGFVRVLSPNLQIEALKAVLTYVDAADSSEVSWGAVAKYFCPSVYPAIVIESVRAVYGRTVTGGGEATEARGEGARALFNPLQMIAGFASSIFAASEHVIRRDILGIPILGLPFEHFYDTWIDTIPSFCFGTDGIPNRRDGAASFLPLVKGLIVCEQTRAGSFSDATAWLVPASSLPHTIPERLEILFSINNQKWESDALEAYLQPLLSPGQSFAHVILRYARVYRMPGQKPMYTRLAA